MARRTKKEIEDAARISEIALAVRGCVVAMRPSYDIAAQAYSALYRDVLITTLAGRAGAEQLAPEIAVVVENRMNEAFDNIVSDVDQLIAPVLKPDTFTAPIKPQQAYH